MSRLVYYQGVMGNSIFRLGNNVPGSLNFWEECGKVGVFGWCVISVQFMLRQGNKKANCYYEATLGTGAHVGVRKPTTISTK